MINKLKALIKHSYKDGKLDKDNVQLIADKLTRQDLKQYINLLHAEELKQQVAVTSAEELSKGDKAKIQNLYPEKEIIYTIDPSMVSGVKIVADNKEYEVNLNRTFHDIIGFLSNNDR